MNTIFSVQQLLPVVISLVRLFIFIFLVIIMLRKLNILRLPYGGMEYGEVIFVSSIIFATFLIATADTSAIFQAYKNLNNKGQDLLKPLLIKVGLFSIVILFFILLLGLMAFLFSVLFRKTNNTSEKPINENIPFSILLAVIMIGFGIAFQVMTKEMIEPFIPRHFNFR